LNTTYFSNKNYEVPCNISPRTAHKYLKVINYGYAKYLDIIYYCDGFAMYKQLEKLIAKMDGKNRKEESNRKVALKAIKELADLGFIGTHHINQNKFLYLKKPAFALVTGDYKNSSRINLTKDLKNDKFRIAILKMEFLIENDELIHNKSMMYHLRTITKQIKKRIIDTNNKFGYSLECIDEILKINDYLQVKNYLEEHPEYRYKLDIIRTLWVELGDIYRKMVLQRETVSVQPVYFKTFIQSNGQIILHYIPNIIIFDVSKDKKFFKDKTTKLFEAFYKIEGNALRGIHNTYIKSNRTSMGYEGEHHIGYTITLIGEDLEVLKEKKRVIDEVIGNSANTPVMDYTEIEALDTGEYLYHASRKGNSYSQSHNERIERIILKKLKEIESSSRKERQERLQKENEDFGKDLLDFVKKNS
jgi:hypothetical protein